MSVLQHQHTTTPLSSNHHQISDDDEIEDDEESHNCRRCDLPISEGHAYELGGDRWHMYCFSCSKCSKLLGTSSNFLVLGTGDLICSDCSYACNACGKKIDDLAILTGDQAYCSSCFCCRNCKKRIEDLRYARTSKGLFCMACHEKLLEKKKRHEQEKKLKQLNRTSKFFNDKSLPKIPPHSSSSTPSELDFPSPPDFAAVPNRVTSPESIVSDFGIIEAAEGGTIATVSRTSPKPAQNPILPSRSPHRAPVQMNRTPRLDPPVTVSPSKSPFISTEDDGAHDDYTDTLHLSSPQRFDQTSPFRSNLLKTPNGDKNRKAIVVDPLSSSSSANNILSNYINNETASPPPKVSPPKAPTVNKRTLENDDFIDLNDSVDDLQINDHDDDISKYQEKPIGFSDYRRSEHVPSGLNIQGLEDTNEFLVRKSTEDSHHSNDFIKTPIVDNSKQSSWTNKILSPLSPSPNHKRSNNPLLQSDSSVSRSRSIRSPKTFFSRSSKHKKSESASSVDYKISSPLIIESNSYSKDDLDYNHSPNMLSTPKFNYQSTQPPKSAPNNFPSITSPYQQGTPNFQTPPIPEGSKVLHSRQSSAQYAQQHPLPSHNRSHSNNSQPLHHQRSISDANAIDYTTEFELKQSELELKSVRTEIRDLKQSKHGILKEITELSTTRDNLSKEIQLLTLKLQSLTNDLSTSNLSAHYYDAPQSQSQSQSQPQQQQAQTQSQSQPQSQPQPQTQQPQSQPPSTASSLQHQQQQTPQPPQSHSSQNIAPSPSSKNIALDKQHVDKSSIGYPISTEPSPDDPKQQQKSTRAKFWKRGAFFGSKESTSPNNISGSQSSYSLSNILNNGIPSISAPLLKTDELDELGGNDNKKLNQSINGNGGKYLEVGSVSSSTSSSNGINGSTNALIMSDLFNSTLESRAIYEKRAIPLIITRLIREVEKRGLDLEGIYRKSGATSQMNTILKSFNSLLTKETSNDLEHMIEEFDINAITSSLKRYLYFHLPEPVILNTIYDEFINVFSVNGAENKKQELIKILKTLPRTNLKVLNCLLIHLNHVESFKDVNKMNFHNLAVVFGPTLIRVTDGEKELKDMNARNTVMEFLMIHSTEILGNVVS